MRSRIGMSYSMTYRRKRTADCAMGVKAYELHRWETRGNGGCNF